MEQEVKLHKLMAVFSSVWFHPSFPVVRNGNKYLSEDSAPISIPLPGHLLKDYIHPKLPLGLRLASRGKGGEKKKAQWHVVGAS